MIVANNFIPPFGILDQVVLQENGNASLNSCITSSSDETAICAPILIPYIDKDFDKQMSELGLNRLFLHAFSIRFEHPKNGETLRFNAPLDHKMKAILQKLRESK